MMTLFINEEYADVRFVCALCDCNTRLPAEYWRHRSPKLCHSRKQVLIRSLCKWMSDAGPITESRPNRKRWYLKRTIPNSSALSGNNCWPNCPSVLKYQIKLWQKLHHNKLYPFCC